jgi:hypothetical protein
MSILDAVQRYHFGFLEIYHQTTASLLNVVFGDWSEETVLINRKWKFDINVDLEIGQWTMDKGYQRGLLETGQQTLDHSTVLYYCSLLET